nr:MAG TPA: hypothetical protein [Caudoviricetes sp.]
MLMFFEACVYYTPCFITSQYTLLMFFEVMRFL